MSRQKLLDRLRKANQVEALAKEIAAEQAIDLVVELAKAIPMEEAAKRRSRPPRRPRRPRPRRRSASRPARKKAEKPKDELWTPDKDDPAAGDKKLWTPDT